MIYNLKYADNKNSLKYNFGIGNLQFLHGSNIRALNEILELGNFLLDIVQTDLVILNDHVDLELLDTEADSNKLAATPDETFLLDRTDALLELGHVSLVIPGLHLESNNRLGSRLGLASFLSLISSNALCLDTLSLSVLFLVLTKEVDVIVILSGSTSSRGSTSISTSLGEGLAGGAGSREIAKLSLVGLDVGVPAGDVRV